MKRYLSKVFTILVSGALIASTLFFTASGSFDAKQLTVENASSAKSGNYEKPDELSISKIDVNKIFDKFAPNVGGKNYASDSTPKTSASTSATASTTASTVASTVASIAASTTATSLPTKKTSAATTTTTVKAPKDESKNISFIKDPDYISKYYIVVYTGSQSVVVYGKDDSGAYNVKVKAFTVSTGRKTGSNPTPTRKGVYKIRAKYRWRMLMGPCWGQYCSSISSSYLFHSVPYDKKSPDTLYNASYNNLGRAVSHGCIRMCVRDCKWIYDNCPVGTQVHVVWESGPAGAGVPKRKSGSKYSGWDPSDQWSKGNPYFSDKSDKDKTTKTTTTTTNTTATTTTVKSTTSTTTVKKPESTTETSSKQSSTTSAQSSKSSKTTKSTTAVPTTKPSEDSGNDSDEIPVG